ncbi:MAG: hypothetical protein LBC53_00950 [Spirochaetaceae bacterium]|jgi:hypothetical protein|nr:hypothetical protein [Spirochaetaceae bacterium]
MRGKKAAFIAAGAFWGLWVAAGVLGAEEESIKIGGAAGWNMIESKKGVELLTGVRPSAVIAISSTLNENEAALASFLTGEAGKYDAALSFDEADGVFTETSGNYTLDSGLRVQQAKQGWARYGNGAAFFPGASVVAASYVNAEKETSSLRLKAKNKNALFSGGRFLDDFSIEFWLYPARMESGEQPLNWTAAGIANSLQTISCKASRNRFSWSFSNFFTAPDGVKTLEITLEAKTPVAPQKWSRHLLRFNASCGLLEYVVDEKLEAATYTTESGMESGEIYTPRIGERGVLTLGEKFNGLIDEFRVKETSGEEGRITKYGSEAGSFRTKPVKTGSRATAVLAKGGRVRMEGEKIKPERVLNGRFRFFNDAAIHFFIRASNSAYSIKDEAWVSFVPGAPLPPLSGNYVQIMADFYPSGENESSPYLEEIEILCTSESRSSMPVNLNAASGDGVVELRWKPGGPNPSLGGYVIYYGLKSGEYYGSGASIGDSPVNVGLATSARIDNLKNGSLYYFSVCAYNKDGTIFGGEFSAEVTARPLKIKLYDKQE